MAQPVAYMGSYVWVGNGHVYTVPEQRIAGLSVNAHTPDLLPATCYLLPAPVK